VPQASIQERRVSSSLEFEIDTPAEFGSPNLVLNEVSEQGFTESITMSASVEGNKAKMHKVV
jgi:hypothetical protein